VTQTPTAVIDLLTAGIVRTRIRPGAAQSLDDARQNLAASISTSGGAKRPLLVDISACQPLDPEVRHYYSGRLLVESFSALGLVIESSPFGRMMGNVYLRVARPGIPTQLFTDEPSALAWLARHV
jgi:hypothetical protein